MFSYKDHEAQTLTVLLGNFAHSVTKVAWTHMPYRSKWKRSFWPAGPPPREKKFARTQVLRDFLPPFPPKSTFLLPHSPSSDNSALKLVEDISNVK